MPAGEADATRLPLRSRDVVEAEIGSILVQVGPLLEETARQCRLASRQFEVRWQDLDTARGFSRTR